MTDSKEPLPSLEQLQRQIDEARPESLLNGSESDITDASMAMRFSIELLAGVATGGLLGYGLDRWLNTAPWCMIVLIFLGMGGGMLNVIRSGRAIDQQIETKYDTEHDKAL